MTDYLLIDQPAALDQALASLSGAPVVAVDTEFMRERTYFARLCLLQLCADGRVLIIDPLAIEGLAALVDLLRPTSREKLLHAARQDLEVLVPLSVEPLGPVFDTQIAAALLGMPPQVGYGDLVSRVLGLALEKGHARTDWTLRPLKAAQLAYAADDVRYLPALRDELATRLEALGRLGWLQEETRCLEDPALYRVQPEAAWRRFKGLDRLNPLQHATVRELARWREERAVKRNLPRGWILPDEAIRDLARDRPGSAAGLGRIPSVPGGAAARLATEILAVIAAARVGPDDERGSPAERLSPEQSALLRRLQERVQSTAVELGIAAEVLATRRDLTSLVRGYRDAAPLAGWRRAVIGEQLLAEL